MSPESAHVAGHPLDERAPAFLSALDRSPQDAMREFYDHALRLLATYPPRCMVTAPRAWRDDMVQDIVFHCVRDDFRVLRSFDPARGSFGGWFRLVARNRAQDWLQSQVKRRREVAGEDIEAMFEQRIAPGPGAERTTWAAETLARVVRVMQRLKPDCRLLLQGAAEGRSPKELAVLLGWGAMANKKASDDLRACRQRLRALLAADGFDLRELEEA